LEFETAQSSSIINLFIVYLFDWKHSINLRSGDCDWVLQKENSEVYQAFSWIYYSIGFQYSALNRETEAKSNFILKGL
jgi:hypothetical protein